MDDTTIVNSSPPCTPKKDTKCFKIMLGGTLDSAYQQKEGNKGSIGPVVKKKAFDKTGILTKEIRITIDQLNKQLQFLRADNNKLKNALKILSSYEEEIKIFNLIEKWRAISQAGMAFIFNSIQLKISKTGGYEELLRREFEAEKRKLEYQIDDGLQQQLDEILESEEFLNLPEDTQQEYKDRAEERRGDAIRWKEREFEKLENDMESRANEELTLKELSRRLKVEYDLIFPE